MPPGHQNDIENWYNYTPAPSSAEARRLHEVVGDSAHAQALLDFGFRPLSTLDEAPQMHPQGNLAKPFEVMDQHLSDEPILVDIITGFRYRFIPAEGGLAFDLDGSSNHTDAVELLMLAAHRDKTLPFERWHAPPACRAPPLA